MDKYKLRCRIYKDGNTNPGNLENAKTNPKRYFILKGRINRELNSEINRENKILVSKLKHIIRTRIFEDLFSIITSSKYLKNLNAT